MVDMPEAVVRYGDTASSTHPAVVAAFAALGVHKLFAHQAAALDAVAAGGDVVICTPTASGKSLVFNWPVMNALAEADEAGVSAADAPCAVYIYPTKALAHDQLRALLVSAREAPLC